MYQARPLFRDLVRPLYRGLYRNVDGGDIFDPIVITAPDGTYFGSTINITGGRPSRIDVGPNPTTFGGNVWRSVVYQLVVNDVPTGSWFTGSELQLPYVPYKARIQIRDYWGNISNTLEADDPLTDFTFALRLQTHLGDNVPLGLYQDVACTIPATADGHSVAAWRDELSGSGLVAVQSVSTKRPTLRFISGVPVLDFDGVDDWLSIGNWAGQATYTALVQSKPSSWNSFWGIVDDVSGGPAGSVRWGPMEGGTNYFHNNPFPQEVRLNGGALTSPFTVPTPTAWNTLTIKTAQFGMTSTEKGIFQLAGTQYGNARAIGIIIHTSNPTTNAPRVLATEQHFQTLAPA